MKMRPYSADDIEAVVAVFRSNIPKFFTPGEEQELRDFLAQFSGEYFVGEMDEIVVAAGGIAKNDDDTVSLCWGMVRNDLIGTGIGKMLTEFRIERANEIFGCRPIVISTSQHTSGFYEKLGFTMAEHIPDGFGPGIDICKMRRDVNKTTDE
jgi:predicted GNAT family N-acyltransferase